MPGTLVVAEHLRGEVRPITLELVTAARELGGPVTVLVVGSSAGTVAQGLQLDGVDEILTCAAGGDEFENDVFQAAVEAAIAEKTPDAVLLGFTINSMGFAPAVAAKLGAGFASDVFAVSREGDAIVAQRSFYGAKVNGEVEFPGDGPVILLLRPTTWPPAEGPGSPATTELAAPHVESRARHQSFQEVAVGDVDITTADFLLSVGRGIGEKDALEQFEELAEAMGATLSVSRPIVDAGWMTNARQVGQSGKTVKPKVYLALGISGAVQHLAGMKTAGTIIAVNTDPEAAIFGVAHYGAVADLFEVAEELEKLY